MQLSLFLIVSLSAIYLGFFAWDGQQAYFIVRSYGYLSILITVILLSVNLWDNLILGGLARRGVVFDPALIASFLRRYSRQSIVIVVLSMWLIYSQEWGFKTVMDELVLAGTSLEMHYNKLAGSVVRGYEIEGVFQVWGTHVDKRPLFFPFILSILHDFTGYRALQGVYFNLFLTPIFLTLVYICGSRFWPKYGGYLSVGLIVSVPLLAICATSGGFELLNLVMILLAGLATLRFLRDSSVLNLNLMLLLFVLLAQVRYESVLFVVVAGIAILFVWFRDRRILISWTLVVTPLLLVVYGLQRILMAQNAHYWQLDDDRSAFGLNYILENLKHASGFFFNHGATQPNSLFLSLLFCFACVVVLYYILFRKNDCWIGCRICRGVFIGFSAVIVFNYLLTMSYHWGQLDDIAATRIALPFILLQVFVVCYAFSLLSLGQISRTCLYLFIFICVLGQSRSYMAQTNYQPWAIKKAQLEYMAEVAIDAGKHGNPLIISQPHTAVLLEKCSGALGGVVLDDPQKIAFHMELHTFTDFLIVSLVPTKYVPLEKHELLSEASELGKYYESTFEMEVLDQKQLNEYCYVRLSRILRVKSVDGSDLDLTTNIQVNYIGEAIGDTKGALERFAKELP